MAKTKKGGSRPTKPGKVSEQEELQSATTPQRVKLEAKRQVMVATNTDGSVVALMSAKQISDYLGIGRSTLRRYVKNGIIPSIKMGGFVRFDVLAVRAALDRYS